MRSLSKPPKTKKIEKQTDKEAQKKIQNKKITKTVFISPFQSKIQTLSHEDIDRLRHDFLPYLKDLRQKMPIKVPSNAQRKFISFDAKGNVLSTLTSNDLVLGVKSCMRELKQMKELKDKRLEHNLELLIVFYEESRHELLEQLFCRALDKKVALIITRSDKAIEDQLGVKTLTCMGLKEASISHRLSKLTIKCSVQIPWLVNKQWIGLGSN